MTRVANEDQVVDFVRASRAAKAPFEIVAGGTRRAVGRPLGDLPMLDVSSLSGIVKYEPAELIITAQPATPLTEIKAVLAEKGQRLGFDPADWSRLLGSNGVATLAGAASADASGSGKLRHGGARDSLLAFRAVNGLGEAFRGGAKVVKNVTGFDLPKLMCASMGTLGPLTELTLRVFPRPDCSAVLVTDEMPPEDGLACLRRVWSGPLDPSGLMYRAGAAHIRLDGSAEVLKEKIAALRALLAGVRLRESADDFDAPMQAPEGALWRLAVPPSEAASVAAGSGAADWWADGAGGVLWIVTDVTADLHPAAARAGGSAVRLTGGGAVPPFAPEPAARAALTRAVKAAFDPLGLFNPGRMWEGV
ncbi:MAG TPA: FAD-binding protein [Rhizomicrobium sp.]|nr:FAD-binding protein [Rhizomicrobium sp.]